ncbi:serine/threonine-protein kinase [Nocardia macrotermitis]|uniref:non-specific serine/threonine protein kinase n=1 Tax=Nocardia macrotermitis TaxID=2585198 RepID=A0A7K0DC44_9NOCA|nr:protein kinase [Nocardia macrotermitis]MQY23297.1 Serine/threonine-protein kinase PknD [Nocardia macrotermitis]
MNASRPRTGGRFGPYELRSMLGRGSMGEVYEAYDTHNDRVVAVKLLPEELAQDPGYRERFRRESHAATRIADPHIVPINRAGEIDGMLYLDMRLIRGDNLRALLRRQGPMEAERAVHIVEQIATALDAAHGAGLVHRDVKPANILVTPTDFAFLTDFGIARSEGDSATTMVGVTAGSYTYMAPERFDSGPVTGRSDTYSLACVLYECLTGSTPFPVQNVSSLIRAHLSETPPRPSRQRSDVPEALDAVLTHAMSKSPDDRFATTGEFAGAARAAVGLSGASETTVAAPPPPPAPASVAPPRPPETGAVRPGPLPPLPQRVAPGPGAPRPVLEPTTFQPFGPDGPTIAAQFQPRGDDQPHEEFASEPREESAPTTGSMAAVGRTGTGVRSDADATTNAMARGPVPTAADQDIPDEPAPAPRGYETTGSFRIIAPPDPEERDTSNDLPVITPADPTRMPREEFEFAPQEPVLPQRAADPTPPPKLPQRAPQTGSIPKLQQPVADSPQPPLPQRGSQSLPIPPRTSPSEQSSPSLPLRTPQSDPSAPQLPQRTSQSDPSTSLLPQRGTQSDQPPLPQRASQSDPSAPQLPQRGSQSIPIPPRTSPSEQSSPSLPLRTPQSDPSAPQLPQRGSQSIPIPPRTSPSEQSSPSLPLRTPQSDPSAPQLPQRGSQSIPIPPRTSPSEQSSPSLPLRAPQSDASAPQLPQRTSQPDPSTSLLPQRGTQSDQQAPQLPQRGSQSDPSTPPMPQQAIQPMPKLPQRAPESDDPGLNLPPQAAAPIPPTSILPLRAPESDDSSPHTELLPHGTTAGAAAAGVIGAGYAEYEEDSQYESQDGYDREADYRGESETGYRADDEADYRAEDGYADGYDDYDPNATRVHGYAEYDETSYAANEYGRNEYDDGTYDEGGYDENDYASGEYEQGEYEQGEYDDRTPHSVLGYGPDDNGAYAEDYDYADTGYDDPGSKPKRKRSVAVPVVLGFLGAALAVGVGVVGWQVLGKSPTSSSSAAQQTAAVAATSGAQAAPAPQSSETTTSAATSTPPVGSTSCSSSSSGQDTEFTRSASGNSQTSCGFAEAVRKAYAKAAANSGTDSATSIVAVSPTTGRSYSMTCEATGRLVTCTGGDNAIVYVY